MKKRQPKDSTVSGETKARHMLKQLRDRPRKVVPLIDYYTTHSPAPPLDTTDPTLPTSTTMSTDRRDYKMQAPRRYEFSASPKVQATEQASGTMGPISPTVEDRTNPNPDWVPCALDSLGVPSEILEHARQIELWATSNNLSGWQLMGVADRRLVTAHDPIETTAEVLRALANDLRTAEPQVSAWADYLAERIGGKPL